jgi:outer membrane receptor protein involved in Fe transport
MTPVTNRKYQSSVSLVAIALVAALVYAAPAYAQAPKYKLDIPSESAAKALNDFAEQAGLQILFPYEAADVGRVPAIKGEYTREEALKLILAGTNLEVARQDEKTISLRVVKNPTASADEAVEVVVTGTHIRGGNPTSPVRTLTRKDIDSSGYGQVGDLIRSLPENFSGGQNPGVIAANGNIPDNSNASNASTVNLRGLGTDATLVLINGRRLATDSYFQGSDISGIPLASVQRVDIVADGASALYGADAVAGVVNFVLRRNYTGAQVSARLSGTTQGGGNERLYSGLAGWSGSNGYLMANLERSEQEALTTGKRNLNIAAPEATLIQPQDRNSLFLSGGYDLSDKVSLTLDTLLSKRETQSTLRTRPTGPTYVTDSETPAYSAALGLNWQLAGDWELKLSATAAGSHYSSFGRVTTSTTGTRVRYANSAQSFEALMDGTLLQTRAGDVKLAAGAGSRTADFEYLTPGVSGYFEAERDIQYAFAEVQMPLVKPSVQRLGLQELEVSLAARSERYSDFGTASSPKVGVRYVPVSDLTVRASWGRSFKAPSFHQMYQDIQLLLVPKTLIGGTGTGHAFITYGGNPDLNPERSISKTLGFDYQPRAFKTLRLSASFYDVDYKDRVVRPIPNLSAALSNPVYVPFIYLAPSAAEQAALIASANTFVNYTGVPHDPARVEVWAKTQNANATAQSIRGMDLSYRQSFDTQIGRFDAQLVGTWTRLRQQTLPNLPELTLSGTIFHVPDFKARAGLGWQNGPWAVNGFVNYVSDEIDDGVTPHQPISAWTTADARIAYRFENTGALQDLSVAVSVTNLFDQKPPFALSPSLSYTGINFDSTNHSIIGRFVSLTLTKEW